MGLLFSAILKDSLMATTLPNQGFVFWNIGTGDSTSIVVRDDLVMQVDLHHLESSEEDDDHRTPIIDELVRLLPKKDGKPFLSVFALTHPDRDHCRGFAELNRRVTIGELWFTPRVFRDYQDKDAVLCDDAEAFHKEAKRRVRLAIKHGGETESTDRVRLIGRDEILDEEEFAGFPRDCFSVPGHEVTTLDGEDVSEYFRAFIHSPFKDDADGERNDTSLGMQVTLINGDKSARALLFGDLKYPILKQIFDRSDATDLQWDLLLAPHHCSKSVMYWRNDGEDEESLRQDIIDAIETAASSVGTTYIISSSDAVPNSDSPNQNPPHAKAKKEYLKIASFLCTQEYPSEADAQPIIFELTIQGLQLSDPVEADDSSKSISAREAVAQAVVAGRGAAEPPINKVGYGK